MEHTNQTNDYDDDFEDEDDEYDYQNVYATNAGPVDPHTRMLKTFHRIHSNDIIYLLAVLDLPDGLPRMIEAMNQAAARRSQFERNGPAAIDSRSRRQRAMLYVLLADRQRVATTHDAARLAGELLNIPVDADRWRSFGRKNMLTHIWARLKQQPAKVRDDLLARLRARLHGAKPASCGLA